MNVWTYWECKSCGNIISGKTRSCPGCGSPIPNGAKYLMPDDEKVLKAKSEGKLFDSGEIFEDEKGIKSEVVSSSEERHSPNWCCPYCGYQNFSGSFQNSCIFCIQGAPLKICPFLYV